MAIAVLDAFIDSGVITEQTPGSFAVSAATSSATRTLVYGQVYEGTTENITAVSYGGQAMTDRISAIVTGAGRMHVRLWTLDEAGLQASSGTAFVITGDTSDTYRSFIGSIEGVDQTTPIQDTAIILGSLSSTTVGIDVVEDGFVVAVAGNGGTAGTGHSWTNITERLESLANLSRSLAHDLVASDATITIDVDIGGGGGAQSLAALSFNPSVTSITARATGASISSGSAVSSNPASVINLSGVTSSVSAAGAVIQKSLALSGGSASVSGASATAQVVLVITGRATSASVSAAFARSTKLLTASASSASISGGSAAGTLVKLARAASASISGGSANGSEFAGTRATGLSVSGGQANALPPVPITPPTPLADSFVLGQRPVILVDLFFDTAELNIWTRPNNGEFAQKEYQALAGITSGITLRNSLDANSFEASIQLSGQSQELLNIALTENYRNRQAIVYLANLGEDGEIEAIETVLPGVIVNMPVSDTAEESTVSVVVESVFRSIARLETLRLSSADQALVSADDTFFDFIETTRVNEPTFGGN